MMYYPLCPCLDPKIVKHTVATLAFSLAPLGLSAHPHAWIDVDSTVILNADGMVTAIEQEWLFDELYTSAILSGIEEESPAEKNVVGLFANEVIHNLHPYNYFLRIVADDQAITILPVTQYHSDLQNGQQLRLRFTATLAKPIAARHQSWYFSVYDPSYFIRMEHRPEQPPRVQGQHALSCTTQVEAAQPSAELVAHAYMLDKNATPDQELGHLFAQKVRMQCQ